MQAQLIALDWGTTSLRAYMLGSHGQVLEQRALSYGIMQLPTPPRPISGALADNGFELAFDEACGDWLRAQPTLPVIACGMVGSAQGWVQAPYCPTPARVADLGAAMVRVRTRSGVTLHVVPGIVQNSALPNVMRGEETQVLGLLQGLPADTRNEPLLVGLPGSHSKWVRVVEGCIQQFDTFMTGELFAAVSAHTILGRTQELGGPFDGVAFDRGVHTALSTEGDIGPLSTLFSARTLGLTGQLPGSAQADYLSGLLIGHELRSLGEVLRARMKSSRLPDVVLIGNDQLCERYRRALQACDFPCVDVAAQATERGLWSLALAAGLTQ
ncbi:2-dehydro-3-deoxygalactonokinase [Pseudomonas sp. dw_358]|uniref:2-dehydro-3-deoxygalactonokinase n=1 Tax=Pseudomonas sp. dw_358 TaxID=2720083 RepID=UPI001BD694BD|nr:2-dehydro-3-deoxygalactonokinase [Pseudomonas sp. dw_358]